MASFQDIALIVDTYANACPKWRGKATSKAGDEGMGREAKIMIRIAILGSRTSAMLL